MKIEESKFKTKYKSKFNQIKSQFKSNLANEELCDMILVALEKVKA